MAGNRQVITHCDITSQQHDVCRLSAKMKESLRDFAVLCVSAWECRESDQTAWPESRHRRAEEREERKAWVCMCVSVCEKGNPCLFVWGFSSEKELLQLHKHTNTLVVLALLELTRAVEDLIMPGILKLKTKTISLVKLKLLPHQMNEKATSRINYSLRTVQRN